MSVTLKKVELASMLPLTGDIASMRIAGSTIAELLDVRYAGILGEVVTYANFYPSDEILSALHASETDLRVLSPNGTELIYLNIGMSKKIAELPVDSDSIVIRYPWDLLHLSERIVGAITSSNLPDDCYKPFVDGVLQVGSGTKILPGVYIEGNVVIGENCKIGPNCYIRGNTSIGNNCHIGQAVEIKNSLIQDKVSVGHLSYLGDCVVADHVNFGAGTICGNLRHDGKNHRSMVEGRLVDTGRRKFGMIVGENVHTGIHTSIYPGRKLFANATTLPGEVVKHDVMPE